MSESFEDVCANYDYCTWIGREGVKRAIDRLKAAHDREIVEALCDACDQCDRMDKKAYEHKIEQMRKQIERLSSTPLYNVSCSEAYEALRSQLEKNCENDPSVWVKPLTMGALESYGEAVEQRIQHIRKAEYSRGYEDGRRSKDADHAAVALRLSRLKFDGGSHENLQKIAQAIYPCATGWTCESSKELRDRLIDLLGGVHEHRCDTGRGCACGDSRAGSYGELAEAMTYDVLGNERRKAVCELRKLSKLNPFAYGFRDALAIAIDIPRDDAPNDDKELCHLICDRLIYLLGGNEKYFYLSVREDGSIDSLKSVEEADELIGDVRRRADQSHESSPMSLENETGISDRTDKPDLQKSPIFEDSGTDDAGEITVTDELRKFATDPLLGYASQELHVERITAIADRIDEQFGHIYRQQGAVLQSAISHLIEECNKLQAECDLLDTALDELHADPANDAICRLERERDDLLELLKDAATEYMLSQNGWSYGAVVSETITLESENNELRAKLEEADAAIANWREREKSFEESERERDELRRSLRQIAERAGVPHDRDLSEYSDEKIANAVIGQLGNTNQFVKSLEWVRDRRLPRIKAERDELKAKLDAMREALDGRG